MLTTMVKLHLVILLSLLSLSRVLLLLHLRVVLLSSLPRMLLNVGERAMTVRMLDAMLVLTNWVVRRSVVVKCLILVQPSTNFYLR